MNLLRLFVTSSTINPDGENRRSNEAQVAVIRNQPRRGTQRRVNHIRHLPGLDYLAQMDKVYLKQNVDVYNESTNIHLVSPDGYSIQDSRGRTAYIAIEEFECCNKFWCAFNRGFVMIVTMNGRDDLIRCERKFKCCAGCCWCADCDHCGWEMTVEAPPGNLIGYIRQHGSKWKMHLTLYDANREKLYDIWSTCCPVSCISCITDINFYVHDAESGNKLKPRIYKKWDGWVRECCTRASLLVCEFPGMNVMEKALFVSACFMIDVMVFERQKRN